MRKRSVRRGGGGGERGREEGRSGGVRVENCEGARKRERRW